MPLFENSLAPNNRINKMLLPGFLLLIFIIFVSTEPIQRANVPNALVVFLVLSALSLRGYMSFNIYYDSQAMYLQRRKRILKVPHSQVKNVAISHSHFAGGRRIIYYTIKYSIHDGKARSIGFSKWDFGAEVKDFAAIVRKANSEVKVTLQ